jgi:hypothetical protein
MHRAGSDAEGFRRSEDSRAGRQLLADALDDILADPTTPEAFPLAPRRREARLHALDYNAALELGKDAEHLKHRPSRWGTGVETLLMKVKIDTLGVQFTKERDQLLQRASEPVGHRTAIANIIVEERIE